MTSKEEFEAWYAQHDGLSEYSAKAAWQAATEEANKRIAELKRESELTDIVIVAKEIQLNDKSLKVSELQAHIDILREALETIATESHYELWQVQVATKALAITPAESLQAFENEVIEKCAKVAEKHVKWSYGFNVPDEIRSLKEVK